MEKTLETILHIIKLTKSMTVLTEINHAIIFRMKEIHKEAAIAIDDMEESQQKN